MHIDVKHQVKYGVSRIMIITVPASACYSHFCLHLSVFHRNQISDRAQFIPVYSIIVKRSVIICLFGVVSTNDRGILVLSYSLVLSCSPQRWR